MRTSWLTDGHAVRYAQNLEKTGVSAPVGKVFMSSSLAGTIRGLFWSQRLFRDGIPGQTAKNRPRRKIAVRTGNGHP
jgi:hypothetical protein